MVRFSRTVVLGAVSAAFVAPGMVAQQSAPAAALKPATGVIAGQLVDGSSGAPVPGAMISLWPPNAPLPLSSGGAPIPGLVQPPGTPGPFRVLTDVNGRFVFHSLVAGFYSMGAAHPGYLPSYLGQTKAEASGSGRHIQLADDQRLTNVAMKIWKFASISGTVLDEAGEPAVAANVHLLFGASNPVRPYQLVMAGTTDDRGVFRFGSLAPSDYLIVVPSMVTSVPMETAAAYLDELGAGRGGSLQIGNSVRSSGGTITPQGTKIGDQLVQRSGVAGGLATPVVVDAGGKTWVYPATYFPGVTRIDSATVVTVRSGEARNAVNIPVKPVPAVRVSGTVVGPDGPLANTTVKIAAVGMEDKASTRGQGPEIAQAITRANGTFTAPGVPAGDYVASVVKSAPPSGADYAGAPPPPVRPSDPGLWGQARFSAGAADVERVLVRLVPGVTVAGRVEFEPGATPPPAAAILARASVGLVSEGMSTVRIGGAMLSSDGSFRTDGVPPGRYALRPSLTAPAWGLKSAVSGGRDLLSAPFDLTDDVTGVVVTYTDQISDLSGSVTVGADDADVYVVLVPVDPKLPAQLNVKRQRATPLSPDGTYRLTSIVAGEYFVVAASFAEGSPSTLSDAALVALARRGTRLTFVGREKRALQLQLVRGRRP